MFSKIEKPLQRTGAPVLGFDLSPIWSSRCFRFVLALSDFAGKMYVPLCSRGSPFWSFRILLDVGPTEPPIIPKLTVGGFNTRRCYLLSIKPLYPPLLRLNWLEEKHTHIVLQLARRLKSDYGSLPQVLVGGPKASSTGSAWTESARFQNLRLITKTSPLDHPKLLDMLQVRKMDQGRVSWNFRSMAQATTASRVFILCPHCGGETVRRYRLATVLQHYSRRVWPGNGRLRGGIELYTH